jgi:hypothetical protein
LRLPSFVDGERGIPARRTARIANFARCRL